MAGWRRGSALLVGVALLTAGPVCASQSGPLTSSGATVSGVTVEAAKKPDPLVDPTTQFVREHLPQGAFADQYPRFHDPVCVKVQGLPSEFDGFIARRIVEVGHDVGAPVARSPDCTPNVHVIFSAQPQAQLADIAKRRDILIGYQFRPQLRRMSKFTRPIQAWYVTRSVGDNGASQLDIWDPDRYDPAAGKVPPYGRAGSRLANGMSAEVVHSLILADSNKVAGEKIDAIADYVTVLALAHWQGLERCNAIPTILNLMAEGCAQEPPQAITAADLGLLRGLYSMDPREYASQQRATIASAIRKAQASDKGQH